MTSDIHQVLLLRSPPPMQAAGSAFSPGRTVPATCRGVLGPETGRHTPEGTPVDDLVPGRGPAEGDQNVLVPARGRNVCWMSLVMADLLRRSGVRILEHFP